MYTTLFDGELTPIKPNMKYLPTDAEMNFNGHLRTIYRFFRNCATFYKSKEGKFEISETLHD
jgi:hypothetical protein